MNGELNSNMLKKDFDSLVNHEAKRHSLWVHLNIVFYKIESVNDSDFKEQIMGHAD